ncbi:hypothetical protein [Chitinophaga oryziterrae]|uniref:hypothetical protein n=1 Tax=Chitinophaga oryziterrae TaxID=1031224 RepID=UPI001F100510|nr:hypothetical protein [Chitinophaga oryziterrae]
MQKVYARVFNRTVNKIIREPFRYRNGSLVNRLFASFFQRKYGCLERSPTWVTSPDKDVVYFTPGEKHWHGATATTAMSHIAIQEKLNGSPVEWMEQVTDEQYGIK